ncbi:hypothetical protein DFH27DRAFT_566587, partial [Peziza echinospora]
SMARSKAYVGYLRYLFFFSFHFFFELRFKILIMISLTHVHISGGVFITYFQVYQVPPHLLMIK